MKKYLIVLSMTAFAIFSTAKLALATDTEPPLGLPIIDNEDTTVVSSPTTTTNNPTTVTTYSTVTPTTTLSPVSAQEAIDDADTGSEVIILSLLSLVAGSGLFMIKKYLDQKRYSL